MCNFCLIVWEKKRKIKLTDAVVIEDKFAVKEKIAFKNKDAFMDRVKRFC